MIYLLFFYRFRTRLCLPNEVDLHWIRKLITELFPHYQTIFYAAFSLFSPSYSHPFFSSVHAISLCSYLWLHLLYEHQPALWFFHSLPILSLLHQLLFFSYPSFILLPPPPPSLLPYHSFISAHQTLNQQIKILYTLECFYDEWHDALMTW